MTYFCMRTDQRAQAVWGMMRDDLSMGAITLSDDPHAWVPTDISDAHWSHMLLWRDPKNSCVASVLFQVLASLCKSAKSAEGMLVQGMDFHRDAEALKNEVMPQHSFKLTANHLEARHLWRSRMQRLQGVCLGCDASQVRVRVV